MNWDARKVRSTFLKFFEEKGHRVVKSSPLLPKGDPTLLFTNAGMNQFKPFFLGLVEPPFKRAASCQKCMRAGGKHNDLDNVGYTKRHHTFFEMLGNFSFGDYFKKEAIKWAYELLTDIYGLEKEKMWVTVYKDDDEAYDIWKNEIGFPEVRILKLGEKDNFWEMGDVGPCGPSSEIHYDLGEEMDPNQKSPEEEGERFLEVWNLVFMQFNRREDGTLEPLPQKNIDTGMGLERLLAILQGVNSNYHTDLFLPIIEEIERITGIKYKEGNEGVVHRVLSDHVRALTFSIADGIYPSNFGRGYVLRRILRRAHRFAQSAGVKEPMLYRLVPIVVHLMGDDYPEIKLKQSEIEIIIKQEEEKFLNTLSVNISKLEEALKMAERNGGVLEGSVLFKLYDTYGLPLDLIEDYAKDRGISLDMEGFEKEMLKQKERARARLETLDETPFQVYLQIKRTEFLGYDSLETRSRIAKYRRRKDGKEEIVLDKTPFYPEGGGQVGDTGFLEGNGFKFQVEDTVRKGDDIVHIGKTINGSPDGKHVVARVDEKRRRAIMRAHSATHLLQAALREILGDHVRQEGSLVEPDRLRFDFTHFYPLKEEDLKDIEFKVNEYIRKDLEVRIEWKTYSEAIAEGTLAFFTEKYGEKVRVVSIGDISKELCGGTHVSRTGEIGFFKIIKEEAVSRGIRRIDALTGEKAHLYIHNIERELKELSQILKIDPGRVKERIEKILSSVEELERERDGYLEKYLRTVADKIEEESEEKEGLRLILKRCEGLPMEALRKLTDILIERLKKHYIVLLLSVHNERVLVYSRVHRDLKDRIKASELVKEVSRILGGGGGGNCERAEGGGKKKEKIGEALERARELILERMKV